MEEQYEYEIHEVTELSVEEVISLVDSWPKSVSEAISKVRVNTILDRLENIRCAFLLRWSGNKVPRGAKLGGYTIAGAQNGIVLNEQRERIGYYDRLVKFGGDSLKEQVMLVYIP